MIRRIRGRQAHIILLVTVFTLSLFPPVAQADLNDICQTCYNMVNRIFPPASKEDIEKYRKSWNPFAAGPMLNPAIDIQPQGQTVIHPYFFGTIGHQQFGNKFGTNASNSPRVEQTVLERMVDFSSHRSILGFVSSANWVSI